VSRTQLDRSAEEFYKIVNQLRPTASQHWAVTTLIALSSTAATLGVLWAGSTAATYVWRLLCGC